MDPSCRSSELKLAAELFLACVEAITNEFVYVHGRRQTDRVLGLLARSKDENAAGTLFPLWAEKTDWNSRMVVVYLWTL